MESDDRLLNLGLMPSTYDYIKYNKPYEFGEEFEEDYLDELIGLVITLDHDAIEEKRSIYTIWDVLGDIGGLIDMLYLLGKPFIFLSNIVAGSGMSRHILKSLFVV